MIRAGADRSGGRDPDAPDRRGDRDREPRSFDFDWRTAAAFLGLTRQRVDEEIKRIVGDAHDRTVRLLSENRHRLEILAEDLFRAETLDAPDRTRQPGSTGPPGGPWSGRSPPAGVPDATAQSS